MFIVVAIFKPWLMSATKRLHYAYSPLVDDHFQITFVCKHMYFPLITKVVQ